VGRSSTIKDSDGWWLSEVWIRLVSLSALAHEHPSYSLLIQCGVFFAVFWVRVCVLFRSQLERRRDGASRGHGQRAGGRQSGAVDGAQVVWEIAIVRDRPRTGQVVARLPRGSNVRVGSGQDGWYPIKYGEGFASEGWLYRAAIGK